MRPTASTSTDNTAKTTQPIARHAMQGDACCIKSGALTSFSNRNMIALHVHSAT